MSKVADFVKRMEKQGRQFEVNGNFVVISPTNGLEMSDLIEMQNINKKANLRIIFPGIARGRQMSNRFYMLCTRETVGSNASFHCHNGNGYSSNIDRAHVYTQEEAQRCWDYGRD